MRRPLPVRSAQLGDALVHDADRLPHLFHADAVAIVVVTVLADRNIEVELLVALIGLRLAQVPGRAGAAHHHARESPGPRIGERYDADVDVALLEDPIVGEKPLDILA